MAINQTCTNCNENTVVLKFVLQLGQSNNFMGCFYLVLMVNVFVGIAIISDVFMCSIETITKQTKTVRRYNSTNQAYELVRVPIWNKTVANLTLMAFGSAAPEILLSTIEIVTNKFEVEKLGPETIVGSSMFNTLVITAFCTVSVANQQNKKIKKLKVFWVTTFYSLAAYVWLYLILSVISPNRITVIEASFTFFMFPLMILSGYVVDIQTGKDKSNSGTEIIALLKSDDNRIIATEQTTSSWTSQLKSSFEVNSEDNPADWHHYLTHYFAFGWKVLFALVPPSRLLNGWITFFVSIIIIAILTALVGDLATSLGCYLNLDARATGLTIVCIGTSLPDLFVSRIAAKNDVYADNTIGNINGSNAFNVFLGLGFPWLCASIYHLYNGSDFLVTDLEGLGISIKLFIIFSIIHFAILTARRKLSIFGKGELGGPSFYSYSTFAILIVLWLSYIILSITD